MNHSNLTKYENALARLHIDADSLGHAERDVLIGVLRKIHALRVHAADVVTDLVAMLARAGAVGDQHNPDRERNQEDRAQHVKPEGCDARMLRAAKHGAAPR